MNKEELIIKLIQQDFKHLQLLLGLQNLGFENDALHYLDILDIVIKLMEIDQNDNNLIDKIYVTYFGFMAKLKKCPITFESEELMPMAKACYLEINALMKDINKQTFSNAEKRSIPFRISPPHLSLLTNPPASDYSDSYLSHGH